MAWPFDYVRHPHVEARAEAGPVKAADQLPSGNAATRANSWLAVKVTTGVGTMWCAYLFGAYVLLALPEAIRAGAFGLVQWGASFFLQLVLLSIIMVRQNMDSTASDKRAEQTYLDAEAILHENEQIQAHLLEQDKVLSLLIAQVRGSLPGRAAGISITHH